MVFLQKRLKQNPKNAMAHHNMAPLMQTTGDIKHTVQHYQCATTYNPMDLDGMVDLADMLYKVRRAPSGFAPGWNVDGRGASSRARYTRDLVPMETLSDGSYASPARLGARRRP